MATLHRIFIELYPDLISPLLLLLLLFLPLHPARPRIEDDDAVQFLFTVLVSGQIQLNMFPTARPFFSSSSIFSPDESHSIIVVLSTNEIATDAYVTRHLLSPTFHISFISISSPLFSCELLYA
jgi:hypothetical protein